MKDITFTIPLQIDKSLSLNDKSHYYRKNKAKQEIAQMVYYTLAHKRIPKKPFNKPVTVTIQYDSSLDIDNHGFVAKAIIDGLKGYLLHDDDKRYVTRLVQEFQQGGNNVTVILKEIGENV